MASDFAIRVEGLRPVERRLGKLLSRFRDLTPLMDRIGFLLQNSARERFETGRGPDGVVWKPSLRARFEAVPANNKRMGPIASKTLVQSGRLRDSVTHHAGPNSVEVGSNLIYARIQQLGGTIVPKSAPALSFYLPGGLELIHVQKVTIPARPYLGISAGDEAGIVHLVEQWETAE